MIEVDLPFGLTRIYKEENQVKITYFEIDRKDRNKGIDVNVPISTLQYDENGMRQSCWEVCPLRGCCLEDDYDICSRITEELKYSDWYFDIPEESSKGLFNTLVKLIWPESTGGLIKKRIFRRPPK